MEESHGGVSSKCLHGLLDHPSISSMPTFPISTSNSTIFQNLLKTAKSMGRILAPPPPPRSLPHPFNAQVCSRSAETFLNFSPSISFHVLQSVFRRQCDVCKLLGQLYVQHIIASCASDASKIQPVRTHIHPSLL